MRNDRPVGRLVLGGFTCAALLAYPAAIGGVASASADRVLLVGLGDSITHGTMNATNNYVNAGNAYLQRVADQLATVVPVRFSLPFYAFGEIRKKPFALPTNLGVDGSDSFSIEGLDYYKRLGATSPPSAVSPALLCDRPFLRPSDDDYDKVLYPINLLAGQPVSQVDAAVWTLTQRVQLEHLQKALVVLWIGNNDSSLAALGGGGANPQFEPFPFDQVKQELKPGVRYLLQFGEKSGQVSFAPYTPAATSPPVQPKEHRPIRPGGAENPSPALISWPAVQRLCRTREKPSMVVTGPAGGSTTGMTTSGLPTPGAGTPSCAAASVPPTPAMAAAAAVPTENCWMKLRRDMR